MKIRLLYFTPLLLAGMLTVSSPAAAKHRVLYEKFTNRGCGPCARFAPASDSLINVRLGEIVPITYHGSYPDSKDPYYLSVKESGLDARIAQYGVNAYPTVVLNGKQVNHNIPTMDDNINAMLEEEQTMDLKLESKLEGNSLSVKVTATPLKVQNNNNLRLFVAAIEEECQKGYTSGAAKFAYVVRHFLQGNVEGYDMGSFAELSPAFFSTEQEVTNFEDTKELAVVAWLQDVVTGKVIECAYAPKNTDQTDAGDILLVKNTPDAICSPYYHATITFRNSGSNPMTSCNVCVEVNGKVQKTPWQGNLDYLDKATITTPDFTDFDLDTDAKDNKVHIYLSDINGTAKRTESVDLSFKNSVVGQNSVEVSVFTDNKPEETAWELYDASGNLIETSEPFTEKRKFYKHVFDLPVDGCYKLRFTDKGGDGIIGQYGNGYFKLSQKTVEGKTKMITQGDFGGSEHVVFFRLENAVTSLDVIDAESSTLIYDAATKTIKVNTYGAEAIVMDARGIQVVHTTDSAPFSIDCSSWSAGVYIVTVVCGEEKWTKTIML